MRTMHTLALPTSDGIPCEHRRKCHTKSQIHCWYGSRDKHFNFIIIAYKCFQFRTLVIGHQFSFLMIALAFPLHLVPLHTHLLALMITSITVSVTISIASSRAMIVPVITYLERLLPVS